jgi:hypothetical protein|nr:MAG TPA: capsid fiber protein [Caudoviricetes sp.]
MESSNMATPGIYKNFEAEGEIGPYVIVTHGTADYAVKAATGATVALVGTTDELGKLSNGRVDVCTGGIPEVALGGTVAAGDPLTSDASGKAVKATAAGNRILGFALVSGASGDIIPYQYSLGTLAVAAAG